MRQVVLAHDHLVGTLQGGVNIAFLAHDQPRLARGFLELGSIGDHSYLALGPSSQTIFSASRPLMAAPVLRAITATPPSGWNLLELGGPRPSFDVHDLFDAGNLRGLGPVEGHEFATGYRRPGNDRVLHAAILVILFAACELMTDRDFIIW